MAGLLLAPGHGGWGGGWKDQKVRGRRKNAVLWLWSAVLNRPPRDLGMRINPAPRLVPGRGRGVLRLLNVSGDELRHLEHADLLLAVEHGLQSVVGIDLGPLLRILQSVFANVNPKLFGQFGTRQRFFADHFRQLIIWLNRLHERCVWCPFGFLSRRHAPLMLNFQRKDNQNFKISAGKKQW